MAAFQKTTSNTIRALVRMRGVTKSKNFQTMSAARDWATAIENQIRSANASTTGLIPFPKNVTLAQVIERYFEKNETANVELGRTKIATLKSWSRHKLGSVPVDKLNRMNLNAYCEERLDQGLSGSSIAGDISILASIFRYFRTAAHVDTHLDKLLAEIRTGLSEKGIQTRSTQRCRIPTEEEIERIIAHVEAKPRNKLPFRDVITFQKHSAMRIGETGKLRWEDVDFERRAVYIRFRKNPNRSVKLSNSNWTPLPNEAFDVLAKIRASIPDDAFDPEDKVFQTNVDSIGAAWQRACKALGIPDTRVHDLRHLGITQLAAKGLSAPLLQSVSGHKSLASLSRYINLSVEQFHAANDRAGSGDGKV
jgi:integrase